RTLPDRNRCGDGEAGGIDHRAMRCRIFVPQMHRKSDDLFDTSNVGGMDTWHWRPMRVESTDRDAPRQLAHGYVGDFHAALDVDDRYRSGTPARDVKLLAVRRECHVPRTLPDRNRCGDGEAGGIDHRDRGV